jgi:RimJ/RimL family protein N-acetyltransferase
MPEARIVPESFATARLLLRKPHPDDAPLIFAAYAQDHEVGRYLTFRPHRDLKDTHEAIARFLENWRADKSFCWLIFRRNDEQLVGAISAREDQGINLGYLLARPFWGQGFMSEALGAIVEWAFFLGSCRIPGLGGLRSRERGFGAAAREERLQSGRHSEELVASSECLRHSS